MISAVEAMAKALVERRNSSLPEQAAPLDWDYIREIPENEWRQFYMGQARAALAALSEVELPVSALIAAEKVAEDCKATEFMDVTFLAIVKALADAD